jgi:hypothetical protein
MFQFTANENVQVSSTIEALAALHEDNDELLYTDEPSGADLIEIPQPPVTVIDACRDVAVVLRRHNISVPALLDFLADPSPFVLDPVASELRKLQTELVR